ncbi:MAG: DNA mismatch repair endonuclease MutL [Deltaproteobacteria bacterium]|nr:DNA mismatch repair endonuclease MutL [Deltaproteobacteria bacterium]
MASILRLPDDLSNQIAAGEVVERPASVVKELIENSIDAGATRIQIDVGAGGVGLIRVSDDGSGMDEQDARLAVERHATSKITKMDDLLALGTFGFRGEALPSIASVSRFALRTRRPDRDAGVEVLIDGGAEATIAPCGQAPGTIIEVRDLFFNVPARRKFLKSLATESGAITACIDALALAAPGLTLVLTRDGRQVRQWLRAQGRKQRVKDLHPDGKLALIPGQRGPLVIEAYLGPPETARSGAAGLTLLVNNRVVRDRALHRVIAHAYGSVLESGRFPVGVVYLDIDPRLVDVNVHPQKAEVRFADGRAVQDTVHHVIGHGLAGAFGLGAPEPSPAWSPPVAPIPVRIDSERGAGAPAMITARALDELVAPVALEADPWGLAPAIPAAPAMEQAALPLGAPRTPEPMGAGGRPGATRYSTLRYIAQVRGTFLICERETGIAIIDQHAAAERVNFARLRQAFHARAVASQRLLLPVTFRVDPDEAGFLEDSADLIASLGFEIRVIGPNTASVEAVPQIVSRAAPERLARDMIDELTRAGGRDMSGAIDLALATMACHGSVRAGDAMSPEEVRALFEALDAVDHSGHCPHGRPLVMEIGFSELERQVARR